MAFNTALTGDELVALRGSDSVPSTYQAEVYLSASPNTVVYSGRVNMTEFTYPVVDITYDGGSGTLADIRADMTVLVSHTNDKTAAYFRGFVRKTPTSTVLYVGANGDTAEMANDDYWWVLDDFQIHEKLPRSVAGLPVPNWDQAFRRLLPLIYDLPSAVANKIDAVSEVLTYSFAPTVAAADADATSTFTYLWDVGDGTITAGSTSTKNITATFPEGFRNVHFTATDSNGNSLTRHIAVFAHGDTFTPDPLAYSDLEIDAALPFEVNDGSGDGHSATVTVYDGADDILDQSLVVVWGIEKYNGASLNIGSAGNLLMVGRLRTETNDTQYQDAQQTKGATLAIEGALTQLANRGFPAIEINRSLSPTAWNEVENLTVWRAIWLILSEYSTLAGIHSVSFSDVSDDYQLPVGYATQGGDLLNSIADLAQSIDACLQDDGAGYIDIARRASMLSSADRAALITIADLDTRDRGSFGYERDHFLPIGQLLGSGGFLSTTANEVFVDDVTAPMGTRGSGVNEGQLHRQVLVADQALADARVELTERAGNALAAMRSGEALRAIMPPGYRFLNPSVDGRYSLTVGASETVRGRAFSTGTYWQLYQRTLRITPPGQDNDYHGQIECNCIFRRETTGTPGEIIFWPQPQFPALALGDPGTLIPLPLDDLSDTVDDLSGGDGVGTFSGGEWQDACEDGRSQINLVFTLPGLLYLDEIAITFTADTQVTDTANAISVRVGGQAETIVSSWTTEVGSNQSRIASNLGGVPAQYIRVHLYGNNAGSCAGNITLTGLSYSGVGDDYEWSHNIDFTTTDAGFIPGAFVDAEWQSGIGWVNSGIGPVSIERRNDLSQSPTETTVGYVAMSWRLVPGGASADKYVRIGLKPDSSSGAVLVVDDTGLPTTSSGTVVWEDTAIGCQFALLLEVRWGGAAFAVGTQIITRVVVKGYGPDPFI